MRPAYRRTLILWLSLGVMSGLAVAPSIASAQSPETPRAKTEPPRLDIPGDLLGLQSFRARGRDPMPPRDLVLWSFEGRLFRRIATTRSRLSGDFDFGEQAIPIGTSAFHVAIEGDAPDRSRGIDLERPVPGPVLISSIAEPREITLIPARLEGALRIRDAYSGRLLLQRSVDRHAPRGQPFDLDAEGLLAVSDWLSIEQVLEDGRTSEATFWRFEAR